MAAFEGWAVLEILGHRTRPGYVAEVTMAGVTMLRVDVPAPGGEVTEFYSAASVYSVRPVSEALARARAADMCDPRPVRPLDYRPALEMEADREVTF